MTSAPTRITTAHRRVMLALAGLTFIALAANAAQASAVISVDIPVANHGFEAITLPDGGYTTAIPSWTQVIGFAGTFNPTTAQFPGQAPEGQNVAFLGPDHTVISQILSSTLAVGTYDLQVAVGRRLDYAYARYQVQLLAGGSLLAEDNNSLSPAPGTFVTSMVLFTALPGNAHLGQALEIRLVAPDPRGGQTDFDNVRLKFTSGGGGTAALEPPFANPEPASLTMAVLGLGVAGLFGVVRHLRGTAGAGTLPL